MVLACFGLKSCLPVNGLPVSRPGNLPFSPVATAHPPWSRFLLKHHGFGLFWPEIMTPCQRPPGTPTRKFPVFTRSHGSCSVATFLAENPNEQVFTSGEITSLRHIRMVGGRRLFSLSVLVPSKYP